MRDHTETTMRVVRGGIGDFNEALQWALDTYDRQFSGATMVRFELEQYMVLSDDVTDGDGGHQWSAVVSGLLEAT